MIYVFLADGFEEIEALAPVDFLKRAEVEVKLVGVTGKICTGAHGIKVEADIPIDEIKLDDELSGVVLPGGMPGADNLDKNAVVHKAVDYCVENNLIVAAICAAPFILGKKGILKGKNATCFPGFEKYLEGANVLADGVVTDCNIITAKGAGVAWEFGAAINAEITDKLKSDDILRGIQWKR
ncbi:MAG: DJ-1/PfpI family protein [Clostridia bacterium]|nr:DJ-1/PfpI family protein [Clostridia bacterium]